MTYTRRSFGNNDQSTLFCTAAACLLWDSIDNLLMVIYLTSFLYCELMTVEGLIPWPGLMPVLFALFKSVPLHILSKSFQGRLKFMSAFTHNVVLWKYSLTSSNDHKKRWRNIRSFGLLNDMKTLLTHFLMISWMHISLL
jgi:hypothetical protein